MIVVSDTSPVLNLARIGRLELLPLLYKEVLIPSSVFEELTASKHDLDTAIDFALQTWLIGASARDRQRVAKTSGLFDHAKPVLDELIHIARFWIGPDLYAAVLAELGEA